ncbi:DUF2332 domain-containing protein [Thermostaphylospora chromogena]|uniref:DUF2332 domain-containing protein n=1 Tax=Thermostaphylospora chromogena TaxID=35622 RepID=A0A1H1H8N9_9ACTN|nr:DUF2332 domain-containing protein [Thermostaphylospora chromogena]SDR21753.1 hypothetical protein SAMN04489764_4158 [Thermostaphylospora chromogena]
MSSNLDRLRAGCRWQRELCRRNGSPIYVALIDGLLDRLGVDDTITDLLTADGRDPVRSALCLRLFAAVNRLAAADPERRLIRYYPAYGGETDLEEVVEEFFAFVAAHSAAVAAELPTPVQTNEVSRAAPLAAAMAYLASTTGLPLRLLEVGASAGLNLLLDRYRVTTDGFAWGPPGSPLHLSDCFESGTPPTATAVITERRGCDLNPLDVRDPATVARLRSFVWPEHVARRRRLDAAIEIARSAPPPTIDVADALTWTSRHAADLPSGRCTVLFHSIVLPYFSASERTRFADLVRELGAAADERGPLAWVAMEPDGDGAAALTCELWPAGRRIVLGTASPHGMHVRWHPREEPLP